VGSAEATKATLIHVSIDSLKELSHANINAFEEGAADMLVILQAYYGWPDRLLKES
jgi:hypothetical protein